MKKLSLILLAVSAIVACSPREIEPEATTAQGSELILHASFEDPSSKTTLVDGTKVNWLPGDQILVFSGGSEAVFNNQITEMAPTCDFFGSIPVSDSYMALYPYIAGSHAEGHSIYTRFTPTQYAVDGNVSGAYLYSAGLSSRSGNISFRNMASGLCFTVQTEGITSVTLRGNENEDIAGDTKITLQEAFSSIDPCDTGQERAITLYAPDDGPFKPGVAYYIICRPSYFYLGLSLEFTKENGETAMYTYANTVDMQRSRFCRLAIKDEDLVFGKAGFPEGQLPQSNEIWYITNNGQPLTDENLEPQEGNVLLSNTYTQGMGVLTFSGPLTSLSRLSYWYSECSNIKEILIPDSIEYINNNTFGEFTSLKELRIPANLKSAGSWAFAIPESSLERFTGNHISDDGHCVIIDGVLYGLATAGLTDYEMPSGITRITPGACAYCNLRSLVLPDGLRELEMDSFNSAQLESISIPASVTRMDHYAFLHCHNLKELNGDCSMISEDRKFLFDPEGYFPNMLFFFAGKEDTYYEIPEGIQSIENYAFEFCTGLESLTFPNTLEYISGEALSDCDNLTYLYGHNTTEDHKGYINSKGVLMYLVPNIDDDFVVPDGVTGIGDALFQYRPTLRSIKMGDGVKTIGNYAFQECESLETITLSAGLSSFGYNPFMNSHNLKEVYFRSPMPPSYHDVQFTEAPNLKFYVPRKYIDFYTSSYDWRDYREIMQPYDYTDLPEPDFYISSDYSKNGEVTVVQKATEGNGIDLVFMGDAYSDRQVASGEYMYDINACVEKFFSIEPYKSFRHLFNVYIVTTVSATEYYDHGGHSLDSYLGANTVIGGNDKKCFDFALKALGNDESRMDEVVVLVCGNQDVNKDETTLNGTCYMYLPEDVAGKDYAPGPAVTYFTKQDESFDLTARVLCHEAGGHGFGKLADEYVANAGSIESTAMDLLQQYSVYNWYSNVDITSDPYTVKWSRFLFDSRYESEGIGVYEGGNTYQYGVWRPTETSIMNDNMGGFNAPSRYTIWYRIHRLAYGESWSGDYEDFVSYDAVNRKASAPLARYLRKATGTHRTAHPVVTGRTWREAVDTSEAAR